MKTSVVMTVYNGERYLEKQLGSILQQTHMPDQIIIADDGSTDSSMKIIQKIQNQWPQIEWCVYKNPCNLGWQKNFMKAFEHAVGDIIFCSDQDDIWPADKISCMEQAFLEYPQAELIGCDYSLIGKEDEPLGSRRMLYPQQNNEIVMEKIPFNTLFYEAVRPGCALAFRKSFLQAAKKYWVEGYPHDELLWNIASIRRTAFVLHKKLLQYRIHETNTTKAQHTEKERLGMLNFQKNACCQCLRCAEEVNLPQSDVKMIQCAIQFFELRIKALKQKDIGCLLHLLRYMKYYTYKPAYLKDWKYVLKMERKQG